MHAANIQNCPRIDSVDKSRVEILCLFVVAEMNLITLGSFAATHVTRSSTDYRQCCTANELVAAPYVSLFP